MKDKIFKAFESAIDWLGGNTRTPNWVLLLGAVVLFAFFVNSLADTEYPTVSNRQAAEINLEQANELKALSYELVEITRELYEMEKSRVCVPIAKHVE